MAPMSDELPRVLKLLWGREESNRPGPKPALSITDIGRAAIRLADADGLAAVSMSKVAAELGFTTMSLYRYVSSKNDLYVVMLDEAYGLPGELEGETWRERMTSWALRMREVILRHPWVLQVPLSEPPLSPKQLVWMEEGLRSFQATGLIEQQKLSSVLVVNIYVRGALQLALNMPMAPEAEREADLVYARRLRQLIDPETFPAISAALGSGSLEDENDFHTDEFTFGLKTILDGVERLVEN